jgi:hypothetical protein
MKKFQQPPIFTRVGGGREKWHIVCTLNSPVAEYVSAKFCKVPSNGFHVNPAEPEVEGIVFSP